LTNVGEVAIVLHMTTTTHKIPASRLKELEKRIAKINKRAAKLEKEPVSLVIGGREQVTVQQGGSLALRMGTKFTYEAVNVTLIGENPVLNGWQFIATVLHKPAGNEFVHHTDEENILDKFVFADRDCDHCHKLRIRNATYIVKNVESGELRQIGSTCLGDFTGYHSPQAAAKAMENIYNLFRDLRTWGGSTAGRTTKKFFLEEFMAFVAYSIRVHGFVSRRKAEDEGVWATADRAKRHILDAEAGEDVPAPADEDFAMATKVITWVRDNLEVETEFDKQLAAIFASDDQDVSEWEMGRAAAAFVPMWKAERQNQQAVNRMDQEYFGNVDDKLNLVLTVERIGQGFMSRSDFWTTPVNFTDLSGRHFVWFSTAKNLKVEVGKTYNMRGTVKAHNIDKYTGNKVTVLSRCTVQGEVAQTPAGTASDAMDIVRQAMA
jgi:hypothetical protein